MLQPMFLIALILLPGIVLVYLYRHTLERYIHRLLAFSVFVTTGLFVYDIIHPNIVLYAAPPLESAFTFAGIAIDNIVSSFLLVFLVGTCWTIIRIELAQEKLTLPNQSQKPQE